jgi:hypothetical protein
MPSIMNIRIYKVVVKYNPALYMPSIMNILIYKVVVKYKLVKFS